MIYFVGSYRGVIGQTLTIFIQLNINPRKLSIEAQRIVRTASQSWIRFGY